MTHPVIAALRERPPGARIALVVEGGGMRGAVSGGMGLGLDELGLTRSFDAAYGASAGALNALWLVAGRVRVGAPTWVDETWAKEHHELWYDDVKAGRVPAQRSAVAVTGSAPSTVQT